MTMTNDRSEDSGPNSSGITVLVVGLGPTGLAAAIECHRRGHKVICFERKPDNYHLGDLISLTGNALRILQHWADGALLRTLQAFQSNLDTLEVYDVSGNLKLSVPYGPTHASNSLLLRRSRLLEVLLGYLKALGVDIRLGTQVTEYWENDTCAGVTVNGETTMGDCVVVADGVHSKGRARVSDEPFALEATEGMAFRAFFHAKEISEDPDASWVLRDAGQKDCFKSFYGKDLVMMVGTAENHEYIYWSCGYRNTVQARSSSVDTVLGLIKDWPVQKLLAPLISRTPAENCLNQKLFTRPPLKRWVSNKGRMIVLGDAAHPFLPHAGQGTNQGIEDAAVLAVALQVAGKSDISLALRVTEKLRYPRACAIQKMGVDARDESLNVNWSSDAHTKRLAQPAVWLHDHDCVKQAYENFSKAADAIATGSECSFGGVPVHES